MWVALLESLESCLQSPLAKKKKQRCCNTTIAARKAWSQKRLCELGSHLRFLLPSPLDSNQARTTFS